MVTPSLPSNTSPLLTTGGSNAQKPASGGSPIVPPVDDPEPSLAPVVGVCGPVLPPSPADEVEDDEDEDDDDDDDDPTPVSVSSPVPSSPHETSTASARPRVRARRGYERAGRRVTAR
jgi:hypothetical protein